MLWEGFTGIQKQYAAPCLSSRTVITHRAFADLDAVDIQQLTYMRRGYENLFVLSSS